MTEGLFAVLGALVGAAGAWIAALIAGRAARYQADAQTKSAHDQWLRQVRRDAYAAFVARADDLVRPMSFWVSGTQEENERHARTVEASSAELHRAVQALSLEAPQEISEQATQVADQARYFAFSHIRLLRGVETTLRFGGDENRPDLHTINLMFDAVRAKCRDDLQKPTAL
ncbi:hypothetical protein [Streptomyces sp. NPDC056983]|uniref:hypothetical protein n=1 Tax=Streptomyces sp. NPDC056983 TaxID=3345987 RepID=UPI00363691A1